MAESQVDRLRAHRKLFILAQELGCTPNEAKAELALREAQAARQAARDLWLETGRRLRAKMSAPPRGAPQAEPGEQPDERWMMRN